MKAIQTILDKQNTNTEDRDIKRDFNAIILNHASNYDGRAKDKLKSFFEDLQHGGCISGLISEFIYHSDCKEFYIKHINALEDYKTELEEQIGEPVKNRHNLPHYTFICWLCFEEYCSEIYHNIFEG